MSPLMEIEELVENLPNEEHAPIQDPLLDLDQFAYPQGSPANLNQPELREPDHGLIEPPLDNPVSDERGQAKPKEEPWTIDLPPILTKSEPALLRGNPCKPYSKLNVPKRPAPRANPLELKLASHFNLPDEMFCECGVRLDYEGKCCNRECELFGTVVNEEIHADFQRQVAESNVDVMARWEAETQKLEGI